MAGGPMLELDGEPVAVRLRRSPRARRLSLRLDRQGEGVLVVAPSWVADRTVDAFLDQQRAWIASRLAVRPPATAIEPGAAIPLRGVPHVIRHCADTRMAVRVEDGHLLVGGDQAHLVRRVTDWLRAEARREADAKARALAGSISAPVRAITVRDMVSRWGSCTADGRLAFSWRLILAPTGVFDYVVAHEVAHLRHFDHSPAFWRLVETLCPGHARPRAWLRREGECLHRIGRP